MLPDDDLACKILKQNNINIGNLSCTEAYLKADKILYDLGKDCSGRDYIILWGELLKLNAEISFKAWEILDKIDIWTTLNPDAIPLLNYLIKKYRIGIISNTSGNLDFELMTAGILDYFSIIIDSEKVGIRKPDEEIYKLALKEGRIKPEEACFICDSIDEVDASYNSGFGLSYLYDPLSIHESDSNAKYIKIKTLLDLRGFL